MKSPAWSTTLTKSRRKAQDMVCAENQFPINEGDGPKKQWEIKQDG